MTDSKEVKEGGLAVATDTKLRKAVEAIAVKPHAGKLTLLTRKIANVLLAEAQEQGVDNATYRIPLGRLCTRADYDSTNTTLVKDQLRKMASTTVEWNIGSKGARRWGVTNMVNVEVIEEGNRCWIEWDYPVKLKAKLLAPDVYARLSLQMQNSFRSSAALALYEICLRYVDSPGNLTMRMAWDDWRPILTGVPDGEDGTYTQYKYFKRDVIKPSVEEVNTLTHLAVELIEHKQGRAVSELQFSVRPKGQGGCPWMNQTSSIYRSSQDLQHWASRKRKQKSSTQTTMKIGCAGPLTTWKSGEGNLVQRSRSRRPTFATHWPRGMALFKPVPNNRK